MTPTDIQKMMNDAMAEYGAGRLAEAERLLREVLAHDPTHAQAAHQLGAVLLQAGRLDEAIAAYQRHLANWPEAADSWHNLAMAFRAKGLLAEAQSHVRKALEFQPDMPEAHNTLGSILAERNQFDDAIEEFNAAVRLRPSYAKAYSNLGAALRKRGQCAQAVVALQKAVELDPQLVEAYNNLGIAFKAVGHLSEAARAYEKALSLRPGLSGISNNLANVYKDAGQLDEAIACYRRALRLSPDNCGAHDNLIYSLQFHHGSDAAAIFREQRAWNDRHAKPLAKFIRPHANDRSPERRLRIGYVSAYFYSQAEAFFVLPLLEAHDHEQFEIHCYACVVRPDEITIRHRRAADVWHDVLSDSHSELAERIAADQIDVLVDLTMHMSGRLLTFARKPAPVQVTWLAYPGGTGLDAMDYRITDRYMDPEDAQPPCYSERSIRLADCWCCYDPLIDIPAAAPRDGPSVTFGSINNPCKLNEPLLRLWAGALLAVGDSRLLVQTISSEHSARITELMGRMGIGAERLEFVGRQPRAEYLRLYDRIDICLDPLPYNGITTTLDALWMGMPVVSLAGQRAAGRAGLSILKNAGLGELAAQTPEQFLKIATDLARDSDRRAELRSTLRRRLASSPLMDFKRFARNMESAYRQMWREWCTTSA
ncbi:MAG: tetratricopeptide repeat protein [Tepidisphaeraceae bacterium]